MNSSEIKEIICLAGADVCGIAGIERFSAAPAGFHPADILPDAKSVIVYGMQFPRGLFNTRAHASYTMVRNMLSVKLDEISFQLTYKLEESGSATVPIPSSEPYEFWDNDRRHGRGILSLKHSAQLAGIGSMGKNTLLVNKQYGNRLWLGAVVTSAVLEQDALAESLCIEGCNLCIKECPQGALDTITVDQKKCREICGTTTPGGGWVYSCNRCRKACPFSRV